MDYVFAGLWLVVGLLLIFRFGRENKVFYLLGAFFLILAGWWIADILLPVDLFAGVWPWVLRGLCGLLPGDEAKQGERPAAGAAGGQPGGLGRGFSSSCARGRGTACRRR